MDNRKVQMQQLRDKGYSYDSIGKIFDVSRQRAHQILSGYIKPRKERPEKERPRQGRPRKPSTAYYSIRQLVLTRDNFTCQVCGQAPNTLRVHHKDHNGYKVTNRPNNTLPNLITVCPSCHAKHHRGTSARNRDIVSLRALGVTFQEIGDMFSLSRQRIHQIYLVTTGKLGDTGWDKRLSVDENT